MLKESLKLLCIVCFPSAVFAQVPTTISGLQLGMTKAQVRAKIGPGYKETTGQPNIVPGEPYQQTFGRMPMPITSNSDQTKRDAYSLEYIDDHLIFIQHVNFWPDVADGPNYESTTDALRAKFGQPKRSDKLSTSGFMSWSWMPDGQPNQNARESCSITLKNYQDPYFKDLSYPTSAFEQCGISTEADFDFNERNPAILSALRVQLLDNQKLYAGIMHQIQRLKGSQQEQTNRSKQNKAPL